MARLRIEMRSKRTAGKQPARVLVVEDDAAVARMLRIFLRAAGFEVTETAGGVGAIRVLEREPTDAVILDLVLPDYHGATVLDWLRRRGDRRLPAWVVISALDRWEATSRYGSLGDHFLEKPFDPRRLLRMLTDGLSQREGGEHSSKGTNASKAPQPQARRPAALPAGARRARKAR